MQNARGFKKKQAVMKKMAVASMLRVHLVLFCCFFFHGTQRVRNQCLEQCAKQRFWCQYHFEEMHLEHREPRLADPFLACRI